MCALTHHAPTAIKPMFFGISLHDAALIGISRRGADLVLVVERAMRRVARPCSPESHCVDGEWWDRCDGTVRLENIRTITVNGDPVTTIPMDGTDGEVLGLDHCADGGIAISIAWFDPSRGIGAVDHSYCVIDCDRARWTFAAPTCLPAAMTA